MTSTKWEIDSPSSILRLQTVEAVVFFCTVGVGLGDALDRFGGLIRTWCERDGGSGRGGTWP